jgi:hypothetical protein
MGPHGGYHPCHGRRCRKRIGWCQPVAPRGCNAPAAGYQWPHARSGGRRPLLRPRESRAPSYEVDVSAGECDGQAHGLLHDAGRAHQLCHAALGLRLNRRRSGRSIRRNDPRMARISGQDKRRPALREHPPERWVVFDGAEAGAEVSRAKPVVDFRVYHIHHNRISILLETSQRYALTVMIRHST